jgi:hypothetical protein
MASNTVEQWDILELTFTGPAARNPFVDVEFSAEFSQGQRRVPVRGFYDGEGAYRVRFMPEAPGPWSYLTSSNRRELDGKTGAFACTPASAGNHGPVCVAHAYHFAYADGTPYRCVGTTCYGWAWMSALPR